MYFTTNKNILQQINLIKYMLLMEFGFKNIFRQYKHIFSFKKI